MSSFCTGQSFSQNEIEERKYLREGLKNEENGAAEKVIEYPMGKMGMNLKR